MDLRTQRIRATRRELVALVVALGLLASLVPSLPAAADPPDVTYSYSFAGSDTEPWEAGWTFLGDEAPFLESNTGVISPSSQEAEVVALRPEVLSDTTVESTIIWNSQTRRRWGLAIRHDGSEVGAESAYYCILRNDNGTQQSPYTTLSLVRVANGQHIELTSTASLSISADQRLKCEVTGTTVRAKLWDEGSTEPGSWTLETADATFQNGYTGVYFWASNGRDIAVDDFDVEGYASTWPQSPDPGGGDTFTETFTGDDNDSWPSGWSHYSAQGPKIRHNSGAYRGSGDVTSLLSETYGDITQLSRIIWLDDVHRTWGLAARHDGGSDGTQSGYYCTVTNGATPGVAVVRYDSGTPTVLGNDPISPSTNVWLRCETQGTTIRSRVWEQGAEEPATWNIETTDSTYPSGLVGTYLEGVSNEPVLIDDYRLDPISPTVEVEYSMTDDRSNPAGLDNAMVAGDIYVFATDHPDIDQVSFWIDDPEMSGAADRLDDTAPYDLVGNTGAAAVPFDTTTLGDGTHTITILVQFTDTSTIDATATFDVKNSEPSISVAKLEDGDAVFDVEWIEATISDLPGAQEVSVSLGGQPVGVLEAVENPCQQTTCIWQGEIDTTSVADGETDLVIHVSDASQIVLSHTVGTTVANALDGFARVQVDLARDVIDNDEAAIFTLAAYLDDPSLPDRYGSSAAPLSELPTEILFSSPEFREAVDGFSIQTASGQNLCDGSHSIQIPLSIPAALYAVLAPWTDQVFECAYTSGDVTVHWREATGWLPDDDANPATPHQYVLDVIEGLADAADKYEELGFRTQTSQLQVFLHPVEDGLTLPGFMFFPLGQPQDSIEYLTRHEYSHTIQWEYIPAPLALLSTRNDLWWWLEASGEWMTHKALDGTGNHMYANRLPEFLTETEGSWTRLGNPLMAQERPQYGAFIAAEYLEKRVGPDVIKGSWELIDAFGYEFLGADLAIAQAVNAAGSDLPTVLGDFWVAAYIMSSDDAPNLGVYGFRQDDPVAAWQAKLGGFPGVVDVHVLDPGGEEGRVVPVGAGGAFYADIEAADLATAPDQQATIEIEVNAPGAASAHLILFEDTSHNHVCSVQEIEVSVANPSVVTLDSGCPDGTLVVANIDLELGDPGQKDGQVISYAVARRPTVDAGPPRVLTTGAYDLEGLVEPVSATSVWTVADGNAANLVVDDPTDPTSPITFNSNGEYLLSLTGTLALSGGEDSVVIDHVLYTITDNGPPQVNAGDGGMVPVYDFFQADATVLDDGVPDPPGQVALLWEQVSGPGTATFYDGPFLGPGGTVEDPLVGFSATGEYVLRLTADDGELTNQFGLNDTITVIVTEHAAPNVTIEGDFIRFMTLPGMLALEGTVVDDGLPDPPAATTLSWSAQGPATVVFDPEDATTTAATFPSNGIYTVTLTGDDGELQGSDEIQVWVGVEVVPRCDDDCYEATTWGDPHVVTFDGLKYEFQTAGEFVLADSVVDDLEVQVRQEPWASDGRVSVNTAVAARVGVDRVGIYAGTQEILVNGQPVVLADGDAIPLDSDGVLYRDANRYLIGWAETTPGRRPVLDVTLKSANLDVSMLVPSEYGEGMEGLLGDGDLTPTNDLADSGGAVFTLPVSASVIHGQFADSWRIEQAGSLFDYEPGESSDTFTDLSYPTTVLTLADLDTQAVAAAETVCLAAGVTDPVLLEACIIDVVVTGDNTFADGAAAAPTPVAVADGHYFEDFEDTVGSEWSDQSTTTTNGRTYLGPFGAETVELALTGIPAHSVATVIFDLVVFGEWDGNTDPDRFTATVDGVTVLDTTFSNNAESQAWPDEYPGGSNPAQTGAAEIGTLGANSAVYRIAVDAAHWEEELNVGFAATGLAAGETWAVDNVEIVTTRVLPETFNITVGQTVSNGLPDVGAGNIAEPRGSDEYTFILSGEETLGFDGASWFTGFNWSLYDSQGATLFDSASYVDHEATLAAGTYRLVVYSQDQSTGNYTFNTFPIPPGQQFSLVLGEEVSWLANNPSGSGRISQRGEVDEYTFIIPPGPDLPVVVRFSECGPFFDWELTDSQDQVVTSGTCGEKETLLPTGTYTLRIFSDSHLTGGYTFGVWEIPDPESFTIAVGDPIAPGVPAVGAGHLEAPGSADVYTFDVTAAMSVSVIPAWSEGLSGWWTITESGSLISTAYYARVVDLDPGTYVLTVHSDEYETGTYSIDLSAVPAVQTFTVALGDAVYADTPSTGAGVLEAPGAEDHYQFTVDIPQGATTPATIIAAFELGGVDCEILDDTGAWAASCGTQLLLDEGYYTIRVYDNGLAAGAYSFYLWGARTATDYQLTVGTSATGTLNGVLDHHQWEFTLNQETELTGEATNCPNGVSFKVHNHLGALYGQFSCYPDTLTLPAGDYTLSVETWDPTSTGNYEFLLAEAPNPDTSGITVDGTVASGSISPWTNIDQYDFTLANTETVAIDLSCPLSFSLDVSITGPGGTEDLFGSCFMFQTLDLPPGAHTISISSRWGATGDYQVALWPTPPTEAFSIGIGDTITDGDPSPGAGNIEAPLATNTYTFTTGDASEYLVQPDCTIGLNFTFRQAGEEVASYGCSPFVVELDPQTEYDLATSSWGSTPGTYTFTILPVPQPILSSLTVDQEAIITTTEPLETHQLNVVLPQTGEAVLSIYDCEEFGDDLSWTVLDPNLETTFGYGCGDHAITVDQPGTHTLTITPDPAAPGPGSYNLKVTTNHVDTFAYSLGAAISDGQPATGAGNLETRGAVDRYTFTTTQTEELTMIITSCLTGSVTELQTRSIYRWWNTTNSWTCTTGSTHFTLQPGEHRLQITAPTGETGTYNLQLAQTQQTINPVSDNFTTGPSTINSTTEAHVFEFEVTDEDEYVVSSTCDPGVEWALHEVGQPRYWNTNCDDEILWTLQPGTYHLAVATTQPGTLNYEMAIEPGPTPDITSLTLGIPTFGALEQIGSADQYQLTVESPATLSVNGENCPTGALVTFVSVGTFDNSFDLCSDPTIFLYPNNYLIDIRADEPGTYTIEANLE